MTISQITARVGAGAATVAVVLAGTLIWLLMSDPVGVASAVSDGNASALAMALVKVLGRGLARLVFGR